MSERKKCDRQADRRKRWIYRHRGLRQRDRETERRSSHLRVREISKTLAERQTVTDRKTGV